MNLEQWQRKVFLCDLKKVGFGPNPVVFDRINHYIKIKDFEAADELLDWAHYFVVRSIRMRSDLDFPNELEGNIRDWYEKAIKRIWPDWRDAKDVIFEYELMCFLREDAYCSGEDENIDQFPYPELDFMSWV